MKSLLVMLMALGLAAGSAAAAVTPEQGYREAYRLVREAKMADFRGNADLAAWKWREARMLLQKISLEFPDWNRGVVLAQLGEAAQWLGKVTPPSAQAYELSVEETRGLAGGVSALDGSKLALAKQMEWEKRKLYDIEKYALAFARKEKARRILGKAKGEVITVADIKRAEAAAPTPTPAAVKGAAKNAGDADPAKLDSDADGLTDVEEAKLGTDPNRADTDGDDLSDGDEVNVHKTNPLDSDTDDDGDSDGYEVQQGWDPLEPYEY